MVPNKVIKCYEMVPIIVIKGYNTALTKGIRDYNMVPSKVIRGYEIVSAKIVTKISNFQTSYSLLIPFASFKLFKFIAAIRKKDSKTS